MLDFFQNSKLLKVSVMEDHLNQVIFDCIDTSEKWDQAEKELLEMERELEQFFVKTIDGNNGELPKENSYWYLYMDVVSKVLYFRSLASSSLKPNDEKVATKSLAAMTTVVRTLPNNHLEDNKDFLNEVVQTIKRLFNETVEIVPIKLSEGLLNYKQYLDEKY